MNVVIDVSGIAEILFKNEKNDKFNDILNQADTVLAPDLYFSELANTLWKFNRKKEYATEQCLHFIHAGISYIDSFIDSQTLWQDAFVEGVRNNHSIYDMFYLVAARRNGATLVTNDSDLADICKKNGVKVCC